VIVYVNTQAYLTPVYYLYVPFVASFKMSYLARPSLGGKTAAAAIAAAKKRETFSFPMLSFDEICICLQELGIHVEEEDLVKGKAELIRNVYEQLIYDCLGMSKEELYQTKLVDGSVLKFDELHEESVPVVHFIRAMYVVGSGAIN
jgi:hypothetical protein